MNILVTGGAGFIGSHLSEALLQEGHHVVCFDIFGEWRGSLNALYKKKNMSSIISNPQYRVFEGDLQRKEYIDIPFHNEKIDVVVHLAAQTGVRPSVQDPNVHYKVNVLGTLYLLQKCVEYGVKKLVFASSSSVYGNNPHIPFSEDDKVDYPLSPYAATKKAGENLCYVFHKLYGMDIVCLRLFTVYGPRQRKEMLISSFTNKIYNGEPVTIFGDGLNRRDYTYITDVVMAFTEVLRHIKGYEVYNIGRSDPVTLSKVINLIERKLGKKSEVNYSPMQPGEANQTYANISKARSVLGYDPEVRIEKGISLYIDWFLGEVSNAISES